MVKIELSKYGKNGSVGIEDECAIHDLDERLDRLITTMNNAIVQLKIDEPKDSEKEKE